MYTSFFGLNDKPFAITPDPRYLFLSARHAEALAHLIYGIKESGGFIQLTGEVGTGKTTVVRSLLGQIPKEADVALILNPRVTPAEFLLTICEELQIVVADRDRGSVKELVDRLNQYLLHAHGSGRRVVLIVDEAQNLSTDVLEQVRLLTNLETPTQKLLQIILIGQPELRELLARDDLRQLAQRITGRYHLAPLARNETAGYVRHRLRVAGATTEILSNSALREVHRLSSGIPRIINVICDRALLGSFTQDQHRISARIVRAAAAEVYGRPFAPSWLGWAMGSAVVITGLAVALLAWRFFAWPAGQHATAAAANPTRPPVAGVPAVPVPAPAVVTQRTAPKLAQLIADHPQATGLDTAFSRLFALWGVEYRAGDADPCAFAARQQLECVDQKGSWAELRTFNRPAILIIPATGGTTHQLVLSGLSDERATLELDGKSYEVGIADLSQYWYGNYVLLWRPVDASARELALGARGAPVRWLRHGLEQLRGLPRSAEGADDLFDEKLARLVEDFQRDHQLTIDGIAGVQTQIALDTALGNPGQPYLIPPANPRS
jgi:general secretion pathway protein A